MSKVLVYGQWFAIATNSSPSCTTGRHWKFNARDGDKSSTCGNNFKSWNRGINTARK